MFSGFKIKNLFARNTLLIYNLAEAATACNTNTAASLTKG
jgi:hypothetical protein